MSPRTSERTRTSTPHLFPNLYSNHVARTVDTTSPSPLHRQPCVSHAPGPNLQGSSSTRTTRISRVRMQSLWSSDCMARRSTLVPRGCPPIARTTGRCGITTAVATLRVRYLAAPRRRTRACVHSRNRIHSKDFSKSVTAAARATTREGFSEEYPHCFRLTQPCFVFLLITSHILCSTSL